MDNNTSAVNRKNEYIELLRFVLCMAIFLHHSGLVTGGAVSLLPSGGLIADAFFMLTGYYAVRHICSRMGKPGAADFVKDTAYSELTGRPFLYSVKYTLRKLLRVYPYMAFGTVIVYILECVTDLKLKGGIELVDIIHRLGDMLLELLFLPLTGLMGEINALIYRNAPMWYLSAMLIALPLVLYLCIRLCKLFKCVIVWLVPIVLQILMRYLFGGVLPWQQFAGPINGGYIRGISSILMGGAIYYASQYLRKRYPNRERTGISVLMTVTEVTLLIVFFICVTVGVSGPMEIISLYIIGIVLTLTLSGITYTSGLRFRPAAILGRLSLPIYCIHWGIYRWVSTFFGYLDYRVAIMLTFILCVVTAVILMFVIDRSIYRKAVASADNK